MCVGDWMDNPQTVMITRAPALLKNGVFFGDFHNEPGPLKVTIFL